MTDPQTTLEQRAAKAMAAFPLPSQAATSQENYQRILRWLYDGMGVQTNAALVIDLGEVANHGRR